MAKESKNIPKEADRRIVFVNRFFHPDHSATAQLLSDLAFHLAEQNRRVVVITSTGLYDEPSTRLPSIENIRGVEIRRVYKPSFGRENLLGRAIDYFFMYLHFAVAVFRLATAQDIIIAKTDPPLLSVVLLPVARLKGAKFINWLQDLYPEIAVEFGIKAIGALSFILVPLRDFSLRRAIKNIAIGGRMKARLSVAGVQDDRVSVIPNWSDDEDIKIRPKESIALRREWGLEDKFVVAYSGNLGRAHEYGTLLNAAEILRDEADLVFLFIGGGALTPSLKVDVRARGLEHLFQFQPYQPKHALPETLVLPDVFWVSLLPRMEGLIVPSKFYGNCAAGKPTIFIGDRDGEIARVIEKDDCGFAVSVGDSQILAQIIQDLQGDRARLNQMGLNARSALDREFSRARALESWERVIDHI